MKDTEQNNTIYHKWRRSEAYMVPMTQEGISKAGYRYDNFKIGFEYGMTYAMEILEELHRENKDVHKFYLLAKNAVDEARKNCKDRRER